MTDAEQGVSGNNRPGGAQPPILQVGLRALASNQLPAVLADIADDVGDARGPTQARWMATAAKGRAVSLCRVVARAQPSHLTCSTVAASLHTRRFVMAIAPAAQRHPRLSRSRHARGVLPPARWWRDRLPLRGVRVPGLRAPRSRIPTCGVCRTSEVAGPHRTAACAPRLRGRGLGAAGRSGGRGRRARGASSGDATSPWVVASLARPGRPSVLPDLDYRLTIAPGWHLPSRSGRG